MLGDQLARCRRQDLVADLLVTRAVVSRCSGNFIGGGSGNTFSKDCQHSLGLNLAALFRLDLGQRTISGRHHFQHDLVSLDLDQHLVTLDRFAHLLVPGRHTAFLDRLGEGRRFHLAGLACGYSTSGGSFSSVVVACLWLTTLTRLRLATFTRLRLATLGFAGTDTPQHLLGLHGIALFDQHLLQGASLQRHDLQYHLVRFDLDDQFISLDAVTRLLVPGRHAAFGNGFWKGGRFDLGSHIVSLVYSLVLVR